MSGQASIAVAGSILLLGTIVGGTGLFHFGTRDTVRDVVVTGKERIVESSGDKTSSRYLIFTKQETFENTDSMFALKFNSSDLYGRLKEGMTCTFQVTGWRVPFLSSYRNILSASCGSAPTTSGVSNDG